ncbi:MAG: polysaccharide deacetylase family protein, partial [Alphaproteobacteria bacterium]
DASDNYDPNGHLSVSPEFLDLFIAQHQAEGRTFVSVDDLVRVGISGRSSRQIAITLDDGFADNLTHAWPVFRRRQIPFTIFITPGFCDRTVPLWWEVLEQIIARKYEVSLDADGAPPPLHTRDAPEKTEAFLLWAQFLTTEVDEDRQRAIITALAEAHHFDMAAHTQEAVMSWDEVREIAADPLCTIGAHTMTHPALARLPEARALAEMTGSADRIEQELGTRPAFLAFPYGYRAAAGRREALLARQAGFAGSFTTAPGGIGRSGSRHGLPRVSINGHYQKTKFYRPLLAPGLWRMRDMARMRSAVLGN